MSTHGSHEAAAAARTDALLVGGPMTHSVVVAHRETMVAEALAAGLARYPRILPVAVATSAVDGERWAQRAHALVLDRELPGAAETAGRLQRRG
ncbi:MAG: hypothetical protein ACRDJG_04510, partial [Actinomycetota bacterium]